MNPLNVAETVLPSGAFASIRKPTVLDYFMTMSAEYWQVAMIARIVTIDGKKLSYAEWMEMDLEEYGPVLGLFVLVMAKFTFKGVL